MSNVYVLKESRLRQGHGELPHRLVLCHLSDNENTPFVVYWQTFRNATIYNLGEPSYRSGTYTQTIEDALAQFDNRNPDKKESAVTL